MSAEEKPTPPPRSAAGGILGYLGVAVVMFGAGLLLESQLAERTAAQVKLGVEQDMKQAADKADQAARKAEEEKQALRDELAKEQKDHEKAIQAKDRSLAAVSNRAAGVRHALETDLSAARASGDACIARITRISQALDGVFDSVGEVAGLAKDLGRENEQLKADNKELSDKLAGWQKWNTERMQRIIVTGQRGG
jgi:hypothetical protein